MTAATLFTLETAASPGAPPRASPTQDAVRSPRAPPGIPSGVPDGPASAPREPVSHRSPCRPPGPAALAPLPPGRGVGLGGLPTRTALVRQEGASAVWFDWSANPYRGCEFGCGYCYARGTHAWLGHSAPREFQERIYVKTGFAAALRRDLRSRVRSGEHIAFGTATDPYQPVERREEVMRGALRELARVSGLRVSVTTKSSLVARDVALLRAVGERNAVHVNLTITTTDERLARFLEPRAPPPAARLAALRTLREAGVRAGVFVMPVLPGVTDGEADLRALVRRSADAGAQWVAHQTAFLEGAARAHFLPMLRLAYPRVAARYEVWTRTSRSLPGDVRSGVAARVRRLVSEAGLEGAGGWQSPPAPVAEAQRTFGFAAC